MMEHPTPVCPDCGSERTRPLSDMWATCFLCENDWKMTEETREEIND